MRIFCLVLLTVLLTALLSTDASSDTEKSENSGSISQNINNDTKVNQKISEESQVYMDPETGEFLTRDQAIERGLIDIEDSLIFQPQSIEQEIDVKSLPGGGFEAELPAEFHHTMGASVDVNGEVKTNCNHK